MATLVALSNSNAESALSFPEAEAQLLGAILIDNSLIEYISELRPEHFAEPLHSKIYACALAKIEQGEIASPVTLTPDFRDHPAMHDLGGPDYLCSLTQDGSGLLSARQLVRQIIDLADRRQRNVRLREHIEATYDLGQPLTEIVLPNSETASELVPLDLAALDSIAPSPREFVIPRIAPKGEVTFLTGAGAAGKSLLAQQLCTALSIGRPTLGLDLKSGAAIYLTAEDSKDELHRRQRHICDANGVRMRDLSERLFLISRRGEADNFLAAPDSCGVWRPSPLYHAIKIRVSRSNAQIVVLDNVAHLFPGDENTRADVTGFVNVLNRLAGETGAAVILIGHPNKSGDKYSGSTAWLNAVRSQLTFERPQDAKHDPDARSLVIGKANYAASGEVLRCRWYNWAYVRDEDLPAEQLQQLGESIAASSADKAFFACLRIRGEQGPSRAVGPNPGPNYAPSQFEGMQEANGHDRSDLKLAMERLLSAGMIECTEVVNRQKGRTLTILREVAATSPNASPNSSRTPTPIFPDPPPNPARSSPEHTLPPKGGEEEGPSGAFSTSPLKENERTRPT